MLKPELVLPAGNLEKLIVAYSYGADAVYVGGKKFSLRAFADNFEIEDLVEGVKIAKSLDKKVYLTLNIFAHNQDIKELPQYMEDLAEIGIDGIIISDPGVLRLAKRYIPHIPITISTQANVSNYEAAAFYYEQGARRVVLARELDLKEIEDMSKNLDMELEIFVHGAMCVSYSGRCLLSHFMTGRSANQGACAHPCRYMYNLVEEKRPGEYFPIEEDERGSYIMNSNDLCLIEYLPQLIDLGINAFKVEGRMKSPLYLATVASVYKNAIESYLKDKRDFTIDEKSRWIQSLAEVTTRPLTDGFLSSDSSNLQDINRTYDPPKAPFLGLVKSYDENEQMMIIEQRNNFGSGDVIKVMTPQGEEIELTIDVLYDGKGELIDRARHPQQLVKIPMAKKVSKYSILKGV